jgi:hypothetical protein
MNTIPFLGKRISITLKLAAFLIPFALHVASAQTTIDFEAEGAGAPSVFDGAKPPITIGSATFSGGQLLFHERLGVDQTAVYATYFTTGAGYGNPLTIHFAQPVNGFSVVLTNASYATYRWRTTAAAARVPFSSTSRAKPSH